MLTDRPISELFNGKRPLRSLEFFPPKDDTGVQALRATAEALKKLSPDFVSVTYGAGGSTRERTAQVSALLRSEFGLTVMPHLTCVGHSKDELLAIANRHHASGIRNIMALRGDPPKGATEFKPTPDGLSYANELVSLLKAHHPELCLGVAGYPEKHPQAASLQTDLDNLKRKVDAGAAFVTTQLFFENDVFFRFVDRCRHAGITVPIVPGLMPPLSLSQVRRMQQLSSSNIPVKLTRRLEAAGDDADIMEFVGIDWVLTQIRELLAQGVPGYHLYVLNRSKAALALAAGLID
jgi:methylenetetrahydrofolate reductase (NADPH)